MSNAWAPIPEGFVPMRTGTSATLPARTNEIGVFDRKSLSTVIDHVRDRPYHVPVSHFNRKRAANAHTL